MASAFLALHRQDSIACQRAFQRIAEGKTTIPNEELRRFFKYLGAVTAPETLELILNQFSPDRYVHEVTKDDAMNLYAIWLRMVSVSEPPSLELLDKRKVAVASASDGDEIDESGGSGSGAAQKQKQQQQHWADRFSAFMGNTNVVVLTITRTVVVMIFTLVHWFSVFFRDADPTLRCGSVGIGLDGGHTVLIALDLFIEYYAGNYRQEVKRALEEVAQEETKRTMTMIMTQNRQQQQQQQQQQHINHTNSFASSEKEANTENGSLAASANNNNNHHQQHRQNSNNNFSSGPFSPTKKRNSAASFASTANVETSSSQQHLMHQRTSSNACDSFLSTLQEIKFAIVIFLSHPKNILGLISLLPLDLFLCAGDAVVAATVLNHIRLISVFRNYINPNPPTPVPLTALFADIYYFWMPLWMMTYTFVVFSSVFAIIFIILRSSNTDPRAQQQLDFLTAMYLVVQTFTTVGFGDVFVYGTAETWFAVVLVLIGMIANATVIGSLVALIQLGNAKIVRNDKIRETHAVLHYFSIPRLLQLEILGFQEHVLFSDVVSAFHGDTESFPTAMKDAMILQHRFDVLKQIDPFSQASPDELFFFAKELVTACFKPEEYLSCCSEPHHGIRILLFGLVDRLDARGRYIKTLRSGDCFGLDGILSGKDEEFNHKALAYCDLLVISYDDFHNILEAMPKLRSWIVPALREIEYKILKSLQQGGVATGSDEGEHDNEQDEEDHQKNEGEDGDRVHDSVTIDISSSTTSSPSKQQAIRNNSKQKKNGISSSSSASPSSSKQQRNPDGTVATATALANATAKVLRSPVSMIDTTGGNLSMVHDLRSELRVFRRGLQTLAVAPALNK